MTIGLLPAIAWLLLQAPEIPSARAKALEDIATKVRTLLVSIREDEPISAEILTKRLVQMGASTTPMLVEALETGTIPGTAEKMDPAREAAAVAALSRRTRGEIVEPLSRLLASSTSVHTTTTAVSLLGAVGDRRDLASLCRVVRPSSDEIVDGEMTDAFESAATGILGRDAAAPATVRELLRAQPSTVRWSLMRALGRAGTEATLVVLAGELGVHPEDDLFLLERMSESCAAMPAGAPESIAVAVRSLLRGDEPAKVGKAARCLAAMGDPGCVEELIGLLRHDDGAIRREAHGALVTITNVRLLPDADRWTRWLEAETAWIRDEFPVLAADLRSGTPVEAVRAISKMVSHPFHRREIAEALTSGIEHEPASIRRMACAALHQLGAKSAVPYLERWAEDTDPDLAVEARRTLALLKPEAGSQGHRGSGR